MQICPVFIGPVTYSPSKNGRPAQSNFGCVLTTFKNVLPKTDDQYNPSLEWYCTKQYYASKKGWPIQSILDGYYAKNILLKMNDQYNPIVDGYYAEW